MRRFARRARRLAWRLSPAGRPHRRWLALGTLGSLLVVAARIAYAYPLRGVLDAAFNKHHQHSFAGLVGGGSHAELWLGAMFLGIVATQGCGEFLQRTSFARFSIGVVRRVRASALGGISRGGALDERTAGDVISRVIGDTARFKAGLKGLLVRGTQGGTYYLAVCVMLALTDVRMGAVFAAGGLVMLTIALFGASRVYEITRRLRKKEGRLAARMHAALRGDAAALAALDGGRGDRPVDAKTARLEGVTIVAMHLILGLSVCGVLAIGLHDAQAGRLQSADLFVALYYLVTVHNQMLKLGRQTLKLGRFVASAERLVKLADQPPVPVPVAVEREPDGLFADWARAA